MKIIAYLRALKNNAIGRKRHLNIARKVQDPLFSRTARYQDQAGRFFCSFRSTAMESLRSTLCQAYPDTSMWTMVSIATESWLSRTDLNLLSKLCQFILVYPLQVRDL